MFISFFFLRRKKKRNEPKKEKLAVAWDGSHLRWLTGFPPRELVPLKHTRRYCSAYQLCRVPRLMHQFKIIIGASKGQHPTVFYDTQNLAKLKSDLFGAIHRCCILLFEVHVRVILQA